MIKLKLDEIKLEGSESFLLECCSIKLRFLGISYLSEISSLLKEYKVRFASINIGSYQGRLKMGKLRNVAYQNKFMDLAIE